VAPINIDLNPQFAYVRWHTFDTDPLWCRYDKLMLEQVYCRDSVWNYRRMQACMSPDPVRKAEEVLYVGGDVVRLDSGPYRMTAVRTSDPRLESTSHKRCGVWKRLRHGNASNEINPAKRKGDQQVLEAVEELLQERRPGTLPVPKVWRTVRGTQVPQLRLRTGPRTFSWFRDRGVEHVPTVGDALAEVLWQTAVEGSAGRLAFPLHTVCGAGVVAVTDIEQGWHTQYAESIREESVLINLEEWQ